jgi:hypothetical protein
MRANVLFDTMSYAAPFACSLLWKTASLAIVFVSPFAPCCNRRARSRADMWHWLARPASKRVLVHYVA